MLNNHCYKRYSDFISWNNAKELCENDGGKLPEICSLEENVLIRQIMTDQGKYTISTLFQINIVIMSCVIKAIQK